MELGVIRLQTLFQFKAHEAAFALYEAVSQLKNLIDIPGPAKKDKQNPKYSAERLQTRQFLRSTIVQ